MKNYFTKMNCTDFDIRRRALRAQLHNCRVNDRDTSKDRIMADAIVLDERLLQEFGSLPKISTWSFIGNGGRQVAEAYAEQFKAVGVYADLGSIK